MDTQKFTFDQVINNKSILLTGATGFLAKVFLEKLLRIAPNVDKVYLLIRSNDFDHSLSRLENDIFSSPLFSSLYENANHENGNYFLSLLREKIRFVSGDTTKPRLGLSNDDYIMLLNKVDLVINSAASTDFKNPIDEAILTNTISVKNIVAFIKASNKARLIHVSTCFIHESQNNLVEELPPTLPKKAQDKLPLHANGTVDTQAVIALLSKQVQKIYESFHESKDQQHEALIQAGHQFAQSHGWFNIYSFTKWLGEVILQENKDDIYCSVIRPSIVESCLYEPTPGWIEGLKVADPFIYGIGTNKIKFFPGSQKTVLDLVPVDIVSNSMFLGLIEVFQQNEKGINIFQACSGGQKPLDLSLTIDIIRSSFDTKPLFQRCVIPPVIFWSLANSLLLMKSFSDSISALVTQKKPSKKNGIQKILQMAKVFAPYTSMKSRFNNTKILEVHSNLSSQDKLLFPVSLENLDWKFYLSNIHIPGLKKYVIENHSDLPARATFGTLDKVRIDKAA